MEENVIPETIAQQNLDFLTVVGAPWRPGTVGYLDNALTVPDAVTRQPCDTTRWMSFIRLCTRNYFPRRSGLFDSRLV